LTRWYLAFTAFAAALALLSSEPIERCWGTWAAIGYAAATAATAVTAAAPRRRTPLIALGCAVAGATVAPLAWQAFAGLPTGAGEGSLTVVVQAGGQLLRHGTPYLPAAALSHVLAYDPYEPLMAVFGLPGAAGRSGWLANPRLWLVLAGIAVLYLAFLLAGATPSQGPQRRAAPRRAALRTALAMGSPVLALPMAIGGTDIPVIALLCAVLALAAGTPRRTVAAAAAAGVACALKAIAWPAVPVVAVMLAASRGVRAAGRFAAIAVVTAIVAMAAAAPAALAGRGGTVQNAILFPLGLTRNRSPAASPLPGHLLATSGPAGKWAAFALLAAAGLAFAWWLARRPPRTTRSAAVLLAVALAAVCTLAPAARWGYYGYPLALLGWLGLSRPASRSSYSSEGTVPSERTVVTPSASPVTSSGADVAPAAD
jgi:Glycosyltransferase family 87